MSRITFHSPCCDAGRNSASDSGTGLPPGPDDDTCPRCGDSAAGTARRGPVRGEAPGQQEAAPDRAASSGEVVEAAGVEPASESTASQDSTCVSASVVSRPTCGSGQNRQAPDPENLAPGRRAAIREPACFMTSDPQPPGEVRADAHSLIRLRERTENPQLTDVPSDLRVNGARHASHDFAPPSKPMSPPGGGRRACPPPCGCGHPFILNDRVLARTAVAWC